ncbi:uncharacterized protein PITG_03733 [Phytophthora infestans T30-4]|uniref:Rap-GAP domain-containing protein n=1 Tax=Phytophthora infestans (strain T30-4) TaxID=403677 RepID=D0MYD2_PHYIT|nr:uncharacterized protein PITG_03733 [Phytophthora infestans T30-4]EEY66180.1 conserved hypothetical protein [Phytophthora infestans T30-4]|eukprot:XP_002906779.1 conserved hypothetical protein [Phytophthora infestans T30-4]
MFRHATAATALPPLPAYDGIGGSPSYYCDNAPVRRQPPRNPNRFMSREHSTQAEGDVGHEGSSENPVDRAIREDDELKENDNDMEALQGRMESEDDGSGNEMDQPPTIPVQAPRVLHFSGNNDSTSVAFRGMQALSTEDQYDPTYLMMQLFDITVENRPKLLSDGPSLRLALSVLDRTPDVDNFSAMKKKRHIGNDFVHVVFKECDEDYDLRTLSGQFNDVHIVIQPVNDREYRTEVHVKAGIPPFGPLYGKQIVSSSIISEAVRLTCLNANLACQVFHQDLVGFALNCEERLKQIEQLGIRLATADEWKLDE